VFAERDECARAERLDAIALRAHLRSRDDDDAAS
jgi:hypothetical protein